MASAWFVRGGGKVYGPLDAARLKRLADDGKIDQDTDVATNAAGPWHRAASVKGLFATQVDDASKMPTAAAPVEKLATSDASSSRWRASRRLAVLASASAAIVAVGLVSLLAARSFSSESKKIDAKLAAAHPKAVARGLEDGERAGREWIGDEMPGDARLDAMSKAAAENAIPSNVALIGSGSDEDREAYAQAFISTFENGYREEMPLKLKRARQRGENDGHEAGFAWAKIGKKQPDSERLTAAAENRAEEVIPSNVSLIGAGSDQERREYVEGFVSQFAIGYRKAN
jgi:hypothetical protein